MMAVFMRALSMCFSFYRNGFSSPGECRQRFVFKKGSKEKNPARLSFQTRSKNDSRSLSVNFASEKMRPVSGPKIFRKLLFDKFTRRA